MYQNSSNNKPPIRDGYPIGGSSRSTILVFGIILAMIVTGAFPAAAVFASNSSFNDPGTPAVANSAQPELVNQSVSAVQRWTSTMTVALANQSFGGSSPLEDPAAGPNASKIRVASFNCSMNRGAAGQLLKDLTSADNQQIEHVACILRTIRPDVVLLNEFDYDATGESIRLFQQNYLQAERSSLAGPPITYAYSFSGPVNTGVPSGRDLDHDGQTDGPGDAIGFGRFPGQYGMLILSRFAIDQKNVRTFRKLLWKNMPSAAFPADPLQAQKPWYSDEDQGVLAVSSKSHWDVPVVIGHQPLHILASHPTPPAFDGPEDRNGKRNHDEIRLWAEYISVDANAVETAGWLTDDNGRSGRLSPRASLVILGDQNADPFDGDSYQNAIQQLLKHPRINSSFVPQSAGAVQASAIQGRANDRHKGPAAHDTSDFSDGSVGNLRVDYVLPSRDLTVLDGGVFWPESGEPGSEWIDCSDHRLVWLDLKLPSSP